MEFRAYANSLNSTASFNSFGVGGVETANSAGGLFSPNTKIMPPATPFHANFAKPNHLLSGSFGMPPALPPVQRTDSFDMIMDGSPFRNSFSGPHTFNTRDPMQFSGYSFMWPSRSNTMSGENQELLGTGDGMEEMTVDSPALVPNHSSAESSPNGVVMGGGMEEVRHGNYFVNRFGGVINNFTNNNNNNNNNNKNSSSNNGKQQQQHHHHKTSSAKNSNAKKRSIPFFVNTSSMLSKISQLGVMPDQDHHASATSSFKKSRPSTSHNKPPPSSTSNKGDGGDSSNGEEDAEDGEEEGTMLLTNFDEEDYKLINAQQAEDTVEAKTQRWHSVMQAAQKNVHVLNQDVTTALLNAFTNDSKVGRSLPHTCQELLDRSTVTVGELRKSQKKEKTIAAFHPKQDATTGKFPCQRCAKVYNTAEGLRLHVRNHHDVDKKWMCFAPQCANGRRKFVRQADLRMHHIRMHSPVRPFPCRVPNCKKAFACHSELKRHIASLHSDVLNSVLTHNDQS